MILQKKSKLLNLTTNIILTKTVLKNIKKKNVKVKIEKKKCIVNTNNTENCLKTDHYNLIYNIHKNYYKKHIIINNLIVMIIIIKN